MSYDYNALVESIAAHRRRAAEDPATHLQQAVDAFASLSSHCPMTPLLWMQYAHDNFQLMKLLLEDEEQAAEVRLQTLELGIAEFPGCAVLRLHYLQLLVEGNAIHKLDAAFRETVTAVGHGSHRNEGEFVAAIYRLHVTYLASRKQPVVDLFVQRAETPMKDANDGLMDEVQDFCQLHSITLLQEDLQRIEQARRWAAKTFNDLVVYEDDVDEAMHAEGILSKHSYSHDDMDWTALLQSESGNLWMGLGGAQTANAFSKYAQACSHYSVRRHGNDDEEEEVKQTEQRVHSLALQVYERGVSECPTVESLWISYLRHLMYLISTKHSLAPVSQLEGVASRAVRNCPYSVQLVQHQINASLALSNFGHAVFDPDALISIAEKAIASKFLPDPKNQLELYMTAIRTVKRRILSILAQSIDEDNWDHVKYDDVEPKSKKNGEKKEVIDEAVEQELNDLIEDIRDMYEDADIFMRKNHMSFSEGRTMLWKDRAMTETYLCGPLMASMDSNENENAGEGIRCFEKVIKLHLPPHPDSYAAYIQAVMNRPLTSPSDILRNFGTVRSLFQKALSSIGKPREQTDALAQRDRATALHSLCHDYLEFEQLFGSDASYFHAAKAVRQKLETFVLNGTQQTKSALSASIDAAGTFESTEPATESSAGSKRRHPDHVSAEPVAKKSKPPTPSQDVEMEVPEKTNTHAAVSVADKKGTHPVHKIRIGKLDYPAHPFTVRVTNLNYETEDMDLVDAFRQRCGAVVHAKIVRDKHQYSHGKGKSKGWGLVQFEERESVEKALELNDVIGIHERIVKVERSHVPAAGLVPPGMHRVNPKGDGKSTKRNQKKKEQGIPNDATLENGAPMNNEGREVAEEGGGKQETEQATTKSVGILSFRPRGVDKAHVQSKAHRKVHLSLGDNESKS